MVNNRNNRSRRTRRGGNTSSASRMSSAALSQHQVKLTLDRLIDQTMSKPLVTRPDPIQATLARNKVYSFPRLIYGDTITPSLTLDITGVITLTLASLPGTSEFQSLFDQYRFIQTTVMFIPMTGSAISNPLITVIDYDDNNPLANTSEAFQYETVAICPPLGYCERTFSPAFLNQTYVSSVSSGYSISRGWVDVGTFNTQWYGLKWLLPTQANGTTTPLYRIVVKTLVQFRSAR